MTPDEVAKVVTEAGFTVQTLAVFFANATKPIQVAAIREKIASVQKESAAQQAVAIQQINELNQQIADLG